MNDMSPGDFGDNSDLLNALGLTKDDGSFEGDWLKNPERYLKNILSNEKQRRALLDFVARTRDGAVETDPDGRLWVPLFDETLGGGAAIAFFVVVDESPTSEVHLFLGVRFSTSAPLVPSNSSLMLPLFRVGKGDTSVTPELMGQIGGRVAVTTDIETSPTAPAPGEAGLRAVGLRLVIPTTEADSDPDIALHLRGLQLPGESSGRDLTLSVLDPTDLQNEAINLLVSLIQAQMDGDSAQKLLAFAKMLGLTGDPNIPRIPLEDGLDGLGTWLAQTFGSDAARTAWLQALAELFDNGATVNDGTLRLPLGPTGTPAHLSIGVRAETGAAGRPVITVSAAAGFSDGPVEAAFRADIVRIDLGSGDAVAVPDLRADIRIDVSGLALGADVSVDTLVVGFGLDQQRQPVFILELLNAQILTTSYDKLDLTNPDTLAAATSQAGNDALNTLLTQLGPAGDLIGVALGIRRPTGATGTYPVVDLLAVLSDPLGTIRAHFTDVLNNHASEFTKVLNDLRQLITGDATANAVTGSGTDADPWRLPLEAGVYLAVWRDAQGRLLIGLGFATSIDAFGDRCTVIDTRLRVALVALNLATGQAGILPEIILRGSARARGGGRLDLGFGPLGLGVDHFGLAARWTPDDALSISPEAPNPKLTIDGLEVPLQLPEFSGDMDDFLASVTDEQWELLETLTVRLVDAQQATWLSEIVDALGWRKAAPVIGQPQRHRLALADLVRDAEAALRGWLAQMLADADHDLQQHLRPLARLLAGQGDASISVEGTGVISDPWRLRLSGAPGLPALAVWRQPDGPLPRPDGVRSRDLRRWRPGVQGLSPQALAEALGSDYPELIGAFDDGLVGHAVDEALPALAARWQGSDGVVSPLTATIAGTTVHVTANETSAQISEGIDLAAILGASPATLIRVEVLSAQRALPDGLDMAQVLDMRDGTRDPLAYTPLPNQPGTWHVYLPPRADARLPSGDPDGVAGQVARLRHALSLITAQAGATVLAAPGAGHAAWTCLQQMGSGLDKLVALGLPVEVGQVPAALSTAEGEILRRLAEIIPHPDTSEPDDANLAMARRLLDAYLRAPAALGDLALPSGWTTAHRADLDIHLVYGVMSQAEVRAAMTAIVAAGLSLNSQARAGLRAAMDITSASMGVFLPLNSTGATGFRVRGQALAEVLGVDLDLANLSVAQRDGRHVSVACELSDSSGWLVGGPNAAAAPLDVELRSIEIELQTTIGGAQDAKANRARIILHGARLHDLSYPRLELSTDTTGDLGIDGFISPSAPEIVQLLNSVFKMALDGTDAAVSRLIAALQAAEILDGDANLDPISLANWLDNPSARVRELLVGGQARDALMAIVSDTLGTGTGVSFDAQAGTLALSFSGQTGFAALNEWSFDATLGATGVSGASLRLGAAANTHIAVALTPFAVTFNLSETDAAAMGDLPRTLPIWPAPDADRMIKVLVPQLMATGLAQIFAGLRDLDPGVDAVLNPVLDALGILQGPSGGRRIVVPALLFINPGAWLRSGAVLGVTPGHIDPARAIALMDGLRPFTGLGGSSGRWDIAQGIALRARDVGGNLIVDLVLDEAAFMTSADVDCGGSFGVEIIPGGQVRPAVALFVGLAGNMNGRRAVHFTVSGASVRLFLRDGNGTDLELYPTPANFSQFAMAGLQAALPQALDAIVATNSDAGRLVGDIGDALLLRSGGNFDSAALSAWMTDPAGTLRARWPQLLGSGLSRLQPVLPTGMTIGAAGNATTLTIANVGTAGSSVTITFNGAPIWIELSATIANLPVAETITATVRFDQTGLARLAAKIGPAVIPLGNGVTLRPVAEIDVGSAVSNEFIFAGLSTNVAGTQVLEARYSFGTGFALRFNDATDPANIASGLIGLVIDLLGGFLLDLDEVKDLLDVKLNQTLPEPQRKDLRFVLRDVVLDGTGQTLDAELFRFVRATGESAQEFLDTKLARVFKLIDNLVTAGVSVKIDNLITISLSKNDGVIGLGVGLDGRFTLLDGDVSLWLENDNQWIIDALPAGINVGLIKQSGSDFSLEPSLSVDGVGLRVGGKNKPLLEAPIQIGSIALHLFARINQTQLLGGAQVQISDLAVAVGGGGGDSNPVAAGLLSETNEGDAGLAPTFSPALSFQSNPGGGDVVIGFRAGDGEGPWWLPIRQQFGPLYVGQIGIGRQMENDRLKTLSVLFDGGVSIAGLTAVVDDLELKHSLDKGGLFDADAWSVDLAGLAIGADISGVSLSGGLRKLTTPTSVPDKPIIEYIGMLNARFSTYGLSIYGGYAEVPATSQGPSYTSFFAYGSVLGPFGGPPAFFLTGVGGGFGINREINPPTDMNQFNQFPLIKALDPAAQSGDPMVELERIRNVISNKRGTYWFAAGISFTSFMIVDGVAVVVVEFGNGFELSIFGLARAALPRPQVALVSIELGLIARFSTSEGVIWVQAQLTENSWLLHPSARLTGGFAYVSWFKGDKAGEFVLTLGGYHPNFHRDGYPSVPRLGLNWSIGDNITIKAETYFALTSEAIMAGGLFEAYARFGPAFAGLSFGGNALVYFDPFSYEADAHARVSAGIKIKTIFGTIRLSFTLGAEIEVRGPEFHGTARIEVGPIDIRVRFGDDTPPDKALLAWREFTEKYLELASGGSARALSGIAGKGAIQPKSSGDNEGSVPDGSAQRPYEVASEFELSFNSTIPFDHWQKGSSTVQATTLRPNLGIAPSGLEVNSSRLKLSLKKVGSSAELIHNTGIAVKIRETGNFPIGVWGPAPDSDAKKIPKGEVIPAAEGADILFTSNLAKKLPSAPGSTGISFNQVTPGDRKPLPLRAGGTIRAGLVTEAKKQRNLIAQISHEDMGTMSGDWQRANATPTAGRSWTRERVVPMRVGLLSERIVGSSRMGRKSKIRPGNLGMDTYTFGEAKLRGVLQQTVRVSDVTLAGAATRVIEGSALARGKKRVAPPQMATGIADWMSDAVLMRAASQLPVQGKTLVGKGAVPQTLAANGGLSLTRERASSADRAVLDGLENTVNNKRGSTQDQKSSLLPGEVAVFDLPGSRAKVRFPTAGELNVSGGDARVVVLGAAGRVLANETTATRMKLPSGARGFAVFAGDDSAVRDVAGWLDSSKVAYLGNHVARGAGSVLRAEGATRAGGGKRAGTGWMIARELTDQSKYIETVFDHDATCVAVVLDGQASDKDLADLAVRIDGRESDAETAMLVPVNGKTLIIYTLSGRRSKTPLSVTVAGRADARLDGVLAARITPDALVARMLNGAISLDTDISGQRSKPVAIRYRAPAAIRVPQEA